MIIFPNPLVFHWSLIVGKLFVIPNTFRILPAPPVP
nr:MAG TPA: hypothetical protein [Caudoviricetes sp.]